MPIDITKFLNGESEFSIVADSSSKIAKDRVTPFSFKEFLKYFNILDKNEFKYFEYYNSYLKSWYEKKGVLEAKTVNSFKISKYKEFLRDIEVNYLNDEERRIISNLNYDDPNELDVAIPYFVDKIKEIIIYYSNQRENVENAISLWKRRGTDFFIINEIREYILENYSNRYNTLKKEYILSTISEFNNGLNIEIEKLWDYNDYYKEYINPSALLETNQSSEISSFRDYSENSDSNKKIEQDFLLKQLTSDIYFLSTYSDSFEYSEFKQVNDENYHHYNINSLNVALSSNKENLKSDRLVQKIFKPSHLSISEYMSDKFYLSIPNDIESILLTNDNFFNNDFGIFKGDSIEALSAYYIYFKELMELYGTVEIFGDSSLSAIGIVRTGEVFGSFIEGDIDFTKLSQILSLSSYDLTNPPLTIDIVPNPQNFNNILDVKEFDNFIREGNVSGELANKPIIDKEFRRFYGYTSRNEKGDEINHGLSRVTDSVDFWKKEDFWKNEDVYQKIKDGKLNNNERITDLLYIDEDKELYNWSVDIYGNEYGVYKNKHYNFYDSIFPLYQIGLEEYRFTENDSWLGFYTNDFRYITDDYNENQNIYLPTLTVELSSLPELSGYDVYADYYDGLKIGDLSILSSPYLFNPFLTTSAGEILTTSAGEILTTSDIGGFFNVYLKDIDGDYLVTSAGDYLTTTEFSEIGFHLSGSVISFSPILFFGASSFKGSDLEVISNTKDCVMYDYFRFINLTTMANSVLSSYSLSSLKLENFENDIPPSIIYDYNLAQGFWDKQYDELNIGPKSYYEREYSNFDTIQTQNDPLYKYKYTISEKRDLTGIPYYRNLYSNEISPLSTYFISEDITIYQDVQDNTTDVNVFYDFMICRTSDKIYYSNIGFDYETGEISNLGSINSIINYNKPLVKTGEIFYKDDVYIPEVSSYAEGTHIILQPSIRKLSRDLSLKKVLEVSEDAPCFKNYPIEIQLTEIDRPILEYNENDNLFYLTVNSRDEFNNQYQSIFTFFEKSNGSFELKSRQFVHPNLMYIDRRNYGDLITTNPVISAYSTELSTFALSGDEIYWDFRAESLAGFSPPIKNEKFFFTLQDNGGVIMYENTYEYDLSDAEYYDLTLSTYNKNELLYVWGEEDFDTVFGYINLLEILGLRLNTVLGNPTNEFTFGSLGDIGVMGAVGDRRKPFIGPCTINMDFNKLTEIASYALSGQRIYKLDLFVDDVKVKSLRSQLVDFNATSAENNSFVFSPLNLQYSRVFEPANGGYVKTYKIGVDYYTIEGGKMNTEFSLDVASSSLGEYFTDIDLIDTEHFQIGGKNYLNLVFNTKNPSYIFKQTIDLSNYDRTYIK